MLEGWGRKVPLVQCQQHMACGLPIPTTSASRFPQREALDSGEHTVSTCTHALGTCPAQPALVIALAH